MANLSAKQQSLADLLVDARRNARQLHSLAGDLVPDTAAQAYEINAAIAARLGWEPLGWKIAGTTANVRGKLGLDGPIYGRSFRRFKCASPARFRHAELLDPLVECEFFVTLARDLPPREAPWTMAEVIEAIAEVHAGIEVAECRYARAALPPLTAILADGSASGRYVFGDRIENWRDGLAAMKVTLEVDGADKTAATRGNGPVDALFNAIREIVPHDASTLERYEVHAVTGGTDAQAEVTVRLEENGKTVMGQGADHDTLVASVRAYVNALNKLIVKRARTAPEDVAQAMRA